jgi:hypothetical protein
MVFGASAASIGVTTDDLTARYMAWMSLGGTEKHLPQDVLAEVSASPVLGLQRNHISLVGTPDMLRLGLTLCEQIIGADPQQVTEFPVGDLISTGRYSWSQVSGLIDSNGDAEMWLRVCNLGNRSVVRVITVGTWTATTALADLKVSEYQLYYAADASGKDLYGQNPVMDHTGSIQTGVTPQNLFPMCVKKPSDPTQLGYATTFLQGNPVLRQNVIPFCPDGFVQTSNKLVVDPDTGDNVDGRKWAARGAINGALAVFLYLNGVESNPATRQPLNTQCNLIGTGQ